GAWGPAWASTSAAGSWKPWAAPLAWSRHPGKGPGSGLLSRWPGKRMATTDNMTPRHLLTAANANARRLATLAALTADLPATGEPQAVLERAVDAAAEVLEAHTAAAFLRRAGGAGFDVAAARGRAPVEPGALALVRE